MINCIPIKKLWGNPVMDYYKTKAGIVAKYFIYKPILDILKVSIVAYALPLRIIPESINYVTLSTYGVIGGYDKLYEDWKLICNASHKYMTMRTGRPDMKLYHYIVLICLIILNVYFQIKFP